MGCVRRTSAVRCSGVFNMFSHIQWSIKACLSSVHRELMLPKLSIHHLWFHDMFEVIDLCVCVCVLSTWSLQPPPDTKDWRRLIQLQESSIRDLFILCSAVVNLKVKLGSQAHFEWNYCNVTPFPNASKMQTILNVLHFTATLQAYRFMYYFNSEVTMWHINLCEMNSQVRVQQMFKFAKFAFKKTYYHENIWTEKWSYFTQRWIYDYHRK